MAVGTVWVSAETPPETLPETGAAGGVLSIGGSVTEIVYALGEGDRLVARDTTSVHPPEA